MALGSTHATHTKRSAHHASRAKSFAIKASKAANKGHCKTAIGLLTSAGIHAGMKAAEAHSATPRKRKVLTGKGWKSAFKGFQHTAANVISKCGK